MALNISSDGLTDDLEDDLDDLDTKEITSMKELLQAFGVPTYDIISTGFNNKDQTKIDENTDLNPGCKFTYNGETFKLMFKWTNGIYFGGGEQEQPLHFEKTQSHMPTQNRGLETGFSSLGDTLLVPSSVSNPVGLMRPTTFVDYKDKLLKPEQSHHTPSATRRQQEEMRERADALVASLKQHKINSRRVHLVLMFASPLVIFFQKKNQDGEKGNNFQSLMKINFAHEFDEIERVLKQTKTMVNHYKICATLDNLTSVLLRNPKVLHFSGHGVKNSAKEIGTTAALKMGEGDLLVFEDKNGCADLVSERMLKDILKECKNEIELVFVSSCHSEFIGDIFFNAGIDHVVCILESETISDDASIVFGKAFYQALYTINGYSI